MVGRELETQDNEWSRLPGYIKWKTGYRKSMAGFKTNL